jgi:hypothetical protein
MRLIETLRTPNGKILVAILLAIGLACLLRMSFRNANMIIINGPPIEHTEGKIFSFDNKCYSYKTISTSCDNMDKNKENLEK